MSEQELNIKATIEVSGGASEVLAWLSHLPQNGVRVVSTHAWTPELAGDLVRRISPRAREVLRVMAEGAPSVSFEDLQDELGIDGVRLGGVLASFGFAERAGIPRPYRANHTARRYEMAPEVAELVLDALNR